MRWAFTVKIQKGIEQRTHDYTSLYSYKSTFNMQAVMHPYVAEGDGREMVIYVITMTIIIISNVTDKLKQILTAHCVMETVCSVCSKACNSCFFVLYLT